MALIKCKECGNEVSSIAAACPKCGAPVVGAGVVVKKAASGIWTAVKLVMGLLTLIFVYRCTQLAGLADRPLDGAPTAAPRSLAVPAPGTTTTAAATGTESLNAWHYNSFTDPMTSRTVPYATVQSTNSMSLDFPYRGENFGHLTVRSAKSGPEVLFRIDKGQTMCRSYDYSCTVTVRFDEKPAMSFAATGPSDHSTETAFLSQSAKFVAEAKKARAIKVSMDIYHAGTQVLEFGPLTPLEWPPK